MPWPTRCFQEATATGHERPSAVYFRQQTASAPGGSTEILLVGSHTSDSQQEDFVAILTALEKTKHS